MRRSQLFEPDLGKRASSPSYINKTTIFRETRHEPARLSRTQNSVTPFKPQSRLILLKSIMVLFEKAYPSFSGFVVGGCLQRSLAIVISAV